LNPPRSPSALHALRSLPTELVEGNQVEVINNGAVFDALVSQMEEARSSIHLIVFIWRPSDPSDRIVRVLVDKARQGVACRIIVDPFWSKGFDTVVKPELEAAGCEVKVFRPLVNARSAEDLVQRQHRKLLVVDGRAAITGGFGIWRSWEGNAIGKDNWRDVAVSFRGPVVAQAQQVFEYDWVELTGKSLPDSAFPPLSAVGPSRAMFVGSQASGSAPSNAQKMLQWLIGTAHERVWIANSYFVPSDQLSRMLLEKVEQGLDVRVLGPGSKHDMPIVLAAQRGTYKTLEKGGVALWEYQPAMMHSKVMVVDHHLSMVGSVNLDPMSLRQSRECALVVDDEKVAAQLASDFEWDLTLSHRIRNPAYEPHLGLARILLWFLGTI
jgi:cardiolipin synthase A/B